MKLPSLAPSLIAALLLSTLGCSKKDDAAPAPAANTASYTLDGRTVTCLPTAIVTTTRTTSQNYNILDIQLLTTPQPSSGPETVDLVFQKPTGQPNTAYQLSGIFLLNGGRAQNITYANDVTTLSTTSGGGFSGTFSGTAGSSTIRNGVFTDVRP